MWRAYLLAGLLASIGSLGCGDDGGGGDKPTTDVTTDNCSYTPVAATRGAGGTVTAGALEAGAAEAVLDLPVSSALGGYTSRAGFLGSEGTVDLRKSVTSGNFNPSIGIETAPMVRAVALSAGGETIVMIKLDIIMVFEGMVFDLEERLGPEFTGKVLVSASHTHSGWGHTTGHSAYQMGMGVFRQSTYDTTLDIMEATARAALSAKRAAKIGFFSDMNFDPDDNISRDRRGENDELMGGSRKDDAFFMIRIDGTDDTPIAVIPIYGVHGTLGDGDNSLASTDAVGGMERAVEEEFDTPVVVMHMQGAAGDVSPKPWGSLDCSMHPGDPDDPCFTWLQREAHGRVAAPTMMAAWQAAGQQMQSEIAIEMLTRSVELGPFPETFSIRNGALSYAAFDPDRVADGKILDSDGAVISPIDEFNAPVGAGLCEKDEIMFGAGTMPGTDKLFPYGSCARVGAMGEIFEILLNTTFESDDTHPICQSTRTTISALRIGEYLIGTLPGEPTVMLADLVRRNSPVAPDKTIVMGYSQGHTGYMLVPEDWIAGGFEASINLWGPLEGEYMVERLVELLPMAMTPEREDATTGGRDRWVIPPVTDGLPVDDPAPMAGTIPNPVPDKVWTRTGPAAAAQPAATIARVSGIARFVWIGDDPRAATPKVTLEREVSSGSWQPVRRRSGRLVTDGAIIVEYTPLPLRRDGDQPQTHYWNVEFQAVPWVGAVDDAMQSIDGLEARAALPLGNYRFHVVGKAFDITSDAFAVTAANLRLAPTRSGSSYSATVTIQAASGYRLLDLNVPSNQPVPVRAGNFRVELMRADNSVAVDETAVTISTEGVLTVDAGAEADAITQLRVTDAFGNSSTVAVN